MPKPRSNRKITKSPNRKIIDHPYRGLTGGQWLRGNLHAHTTRSDGKRPFQKVIDDYASRGYDFLMISDHDIFTNTAFYRRHKNRGMTLIPGNEITKNGPHMLHVGADRLVNPDRLRQLAINDVVASKGFIVCNHPNWLKDFNHCPLENLQQWVGYTGIEIYNGVIGHLQGSPYATNKWDILLTEGRRIWGFANDDSHWGGIDVELGWNMVYTKQNSAKAIVDAMQAGRFYASTGVTINNIKVRGSKIRIETDNARRIVALKNDGVRFAVVDDAAIEIEVPEKATYVRFECWGDGESFAWTQPFFIK
jgi:hypothetical protein